MAKYNEQELQNMPVDELRDLVYRRVDETMGAPPQADIPAPAATPQQTLAPAAPAAEAASPVGMEAQREAVGMTDDPFSPESRLAAARSALGRQRKIRENLPKDIY